VTSWLHIGRYLLKDQEDKDETLYQRSLEFYRTKNIHEYPEFMFKSKFALTYNKIIDFNFLKEINFFSFDIL
jgi:hypothetical protein